MFATVEWDALDEHGENVVDINVGVEGESSIQKAQEDAAGRHEDWQMFDHGYDLRCVDDCQTWTTTTAPKCHLPMFLARWWAT